MYLVVVAWLYVVVLMAVAEATNSNGTVLGAVITFFMYGVLPLSLVVYVMRTPQRRKKRLAQDKTSDPNAAAAAGPDGELDASADLGRAAGASADTQAGTDSVDQPDAGCHAPAAAQASGIAAVRKEP